MESSKNWRHLRVTCRFNDARGYPHSLAFDILLKPGNDIDDALDQASRDGLKKHGFTNYTINEISYSTMSQLSPLAKTTLLATAAMAVVEHQQSSCKFLQLELSLTSDQASQVLGELEAAGVVGAYDTATDQRPVLVQNINDLEDILK